MVTSQQLLTIRDVADVLKLTDKTVYAMATQGELPAFKLRGQWRVRRTDFDAWLAKQVGSDASTGGEQSPATPIHSPAPASLPLTHLSERVTQEDLHRRFLAAIGNDLVRHHAPLDSKPLEVDFKHPLPQRVRVYIYNATRPPGGRPLGEHKVQLIVPGQKRSDRGSFDNSDGRIVLLLGYAAEEDVFIIWDAGLYPDFAWSRNVQVKNETIIGAIGGQIASQERQLRPSSGRAAVETVLTARPRRLADALIRRIDLTRERLLRER